MAKLGVFAVPGEFKSEDKWFRYFNRKQALVLVVCGILDYKVIVSAASKGLVIPALVGMLFMTLVSVGIVMIRFPVDGFFLSGGGLTIDEWLFRLLYRWMHREILTKNYNKKQKNEL